MQSLRLRCLRPVVSYCQLCRRTLADDDKRWMASKEEIEKYARETLTRGEKLTSGLEPVPQFYNTTMDDNDQRTTMTCLNTDLEDTYVAIASYTAHGFRLNSGNTLYGPIAVFPKVALSWMVPSVDHITEESVELFALIEPKLDLIILGVGDQKDVEPIKKRLMPFFKKHRLNVEILETQHACATFNYLNAERRNVAAALFPPDDVSPTNQERMQINQEHTEYGQIYSYNKKDYFGVPIKEGTDGTIGSLKEIYKERQKRLNEDNKNVSKQLGLSEKSKKKN